MGTFMIWYVATGLVAAVPGGIWFALYHGLRLRQPVEAVMGLAMAASAITVIVQFAPAFAEVML